MMSRFMLAALATLLLGVGVATAAVDSAAEFVSVVDQRVERGELTADEALLLKFQYCFDRAKLPADLQPTSFAPMKCATHLVAEYLEARDRMPGHMTEAIEGYLAPPVDDGTRLEYFSDTGLFRINYYTSGSNAVPLFDGNSNGVPDFVENIADYMDYSYTYECETLGFESPPFAAAGGYMSVYLADMDGVYGFTTPLSNPPGMTRISMDNDFIGYAPNDDPDGNPLGAAKVTCAHEFKHSTQYIGSFWSEGGWVEVDATWMEEMAYPETNDYLNYLPFGSPMSDPDVPLDGGSTGTGSYEDCVWQHYMSDRFASPQIIVDLWEYRKTNRSEPMMDSYEALLGDYGLDLISAWNEFTMWNYACGYRHLVNEAYYHEADRYPAGSENNTVSSYPASESGVVQNIAAFTQRCRNVDSPGQRLRITFDGADNARFTLAAVINESYGTNLGGYYTIPLDADNNAVFDVPYDLGGVYSAGVVVGNAEKDGPGRSFTLDVDLVDADVTPASDIAPAFTIAGNYPNPFNPSTTIRFTLGGTASTSLDVYDLSGRKVATLVDHVLDAGMHNVVWDGQDDAGRTLASGTYLAKLRSGDQVTTHKLVLAK
ncbi:T9SS type A sorting domain-containing protein [bacterium]|nr:T9SS type A sorting domain-containing protein [bacterium]